MVVFRSFYEKGFGLPLGAFFRGLLHYYGLEAMHLKPNSIMQIATFINLCEGFLGIALHFNLWRALYHLRAYPSNVLVADDIEQEAHIATTPLAMLPAPMMKEGPGGTSRGSADPLVRPNPQGSPSHPRSAQHSVKSSGAKRGRGGSVVTAQRPTISELRPKGVVKQLFTDPLLPVPLEEWQRHVFSVTSKSGNVVSHNYTVDMYTPATPTP
ncbi:hypothetical protein C2845_PM11G04180 [Panicum miliaceum]|uniref:Transposase (putative) gypsy type domain-containing protein n=1 Tax=Panicum miliaceum TaxID=4540 RepID=A0A3L6RMT7_PANMI|nr:hypothetical protein C2845_PM11G04180 [Panicum miliaceum]